MIVITLSKVPPSLRGDLTRWFQEVQTGVYVGNINARVRDALWERIQKNIGVNGEATMVYSTNNETGYTFKTNRKDKEIVNFDGIPLVKHIFPEEDSIKLGFSDAAKRHKARMMAGKKIRDSEDVRLKRNFSVIDIETTGLDVTNDVIISLAAVKGATGDRFYKLIRTNNLISPKIVALTGITNEKLESEGEDIYAVLNEFKKFIEDDILIGFNIMNFDLRFINAAMIAAGIEEKMNNTIIDLLPRIKKIDSFLDNYRFETVLRAYGVTNNLPHNALSDSIACRELAVKLMKNGKLSF